MGQGLIVFLRSCDLQRKWNSLRATPWFPAVLLILVQMTSGMRDMPQFAFFLIYLQEQLGLTPAMISGVVAGAQIAGMAAALLGGAITARLGSKWVLACGLALAGLSSLVFQTHWLWLVALLWLVSGAGSALVTVGGASYLTRLSDRGALGILSALYVLSMTVGGAIGNPIAGVLIEQRGFGAFGWAAMALTAVAVLVVTLLMAHLRDHATEPAPLRSFWSSALSATRRTKGRLLIGMRCLPTIFYGMLTVLIPLLINSLSGSKVTVAAYGTTTLIVASGAQLLAGRTADRWGGRRPTLVAYAAIILAGLGLAASAGTVWGLFVFGVLGTAAAWSLSTLMYVWVADGIPKAEHPSTFGLLHAVWSLSMISGSVLGGWFVHSMPGLPFLIAGLLNVSSFLLTFAYYGSSD
ncbi:MAG: MFS transporter [Chloroflexi bacterium]|nr:MFS transporter [Chloroflexota bacterium]